MRRIRLNGEARKLEGATYVADLVAALVEESNEGVAVAVNGEIVVRKQWPETEVRDGDDVEIVRAVQGG